MKILYFTTDFSDKNIGYAKTNGLIMRDVSAYYEGDSVEICDKVCGDVPKAYEHIEKHNLPKSRTTTKTEAK